jgi:hypothetical protein
MRRLQLIEIHEQPWCPASVRDGATACLNLATNLGRQYVHIVPRLHQALWQSGARRVIDLCSGSGGPWLMLHRPLNELSSAPIEILLTDLYPPQTQPPAIDPDSTLLLTYHPTPVDATQIPAELTGFRTFFTAFHHFPPATARAILHDAVVQRQGIGIFEQTQRSWQAVLLMFTLPWLALLITPFIRPFRLSRFFFTYLLPAIPLILCFDGIVSCLRTYSVQEMQAMVDNLEGPTYRWEIGQAPNPISPVDITYAIGYPASSPTSPRVASTK